MRKPFFYLQNEEGFLDFKEASLHVKSTICR